MDNKLEIAYLTTVYPAVSHTFIRRELLEIERRGHKILRLSIRESDHELVDPVDIIEKKKTFYCLSQSKVVHIFSLIKFLFHRPIRLFEALNLAMKMSRRSERGRIRHLAYWLEACTFYWVLRKESIKHIHVHFGNNSTGVARLIKKLGGPSYSFTVHGPAEFDAAIGLDIEGKIDDSLFVVSISDYCSAQLRRWTAPVNWSKINIVGCTVGNEFFNSSVETNFDSNVFTCIGRLAPQKGQIVLIDAFNNIIKSGHDARLVFVGDGELRFEIEEKIRLYGLEDKVSITGFVSEDGVKNYLSDSRVLVMPSFAEGLPMVIMEAYAIGRPVISTYIAGIPELVVPEVSGWLVPAANEKKLEEALIFALEADPEILQKFVTNGREMTRKDHYTITEGDRLEKLFYRYLEMDYV